MNKRKVTRKKALELCEEYFGGNKKAAENWVNVFAEEENGFYDEPTPQDVFDRLSAEMAEVDAKYGSVFSCDDISKFLSVLRHFVLQGTVLKRDERTVNLWEEMMRSVWQSVKVCAEKTDLHSAKNGAEKDLGEILTPVEELKRPKELDADVVKFQNKKDKWIAFVGLKNGRPYEIFTGLADDEDGILLPKTVSRGKIIKNVDENGNKRYDFQYVNNRGYKTTVEGLSYKFNPEYWNYAKLISGVLRYGMPIDQVIKLVATLELDNESINTWKTGVERALKKYVPIGTSSAIVCPNCGKRTMVYDEGALVCTSCGQNIMAE